MNSYIYVSFLMDVSTFVECYFVSEVMYGCHILLTVSLSMGQSKPEGIGSNVCNIVWK